MLFRLFFVLLDMSKGTVMIYDLYIFITPIRFIDTVEKLQYFSLSHYASFLKIAGITALCTSLNLINYSSHLKETEKKKKKH